MNLNINEIASKLHVTKELNQRIEIVVLDCLDKAQARFGVDKVTKIPKVQYNTTGKAAGWAHWNYGNPYIRINPILLNENVEQIINQVVPHEVAHIVVFEVYNHEAQPHGYAWRRVMRLFGKEPDRCHCMDVSTISLMKNKGVKYLYKCGCGDGHSLTKLKHNRFQDGISYTCKKCRTKLVFDKVEKV